MALLSFNQLDRFKLPAEPEPEEPEEQRAPAAPPEAFVTPRATTVLPPEPDLPSEPPRRTPRR